MEARDDGETFLRDARSCGDAAARETNDGGGRARVCLPRVVSSFGTFGCGERRIGEEKTRRRAKARAKATASTDVKLFKSSTQALKSLNPAHLKALLGQEVLMTLSDGTTRQGTVYSLDPESFTIVLATGTDGVRANGSLRDDACVIVPGHAVKAVEVVGGNALALDALSKTKTNGNGWMTSGGEQGDAMTKAMKSMSASRTNSWGANSTYAGMTALLKPSAGTQLERVKRCLRANMVPFTERPAPDGPGDVELLVLGSLVVSYPFTADSCACPNEIVLARVRELITAGCPEVANGAQSVA